MNKDKENIYGQKIVLRYDAKLNSVTRWRLIPEG